MFCRSYFRTNKIQYEDVENKTKILANTQIKTFEDRETFNFYYFLFCILKSNTKRCLLFSCIQIYGSHDMMMLLS